MNRIAALALVLLVPACLWAAEESKDAATPVAPLKAVAVLIPLGNSQVHGQVVFTQMGDKVEVSGEIMGLKPGEHGFHIHEFGDASSPDGMSAGGHYNPGHNPHACPAADKRHEGDLGNVTADAEGKAVVKLEDTDLKLSGPDSIIGRGVIVHADRDDCTTQPSGNAGARIAIGVVGIAKH